MIVPFYCQQNVSPGVRVIFLRRVSIPANEVATRAGRGQAIAPTMTTMELPAKLVHSRGDGLSSPWRGILTLWPVKNRTHTFSLFSLDG